MVIIIKCDIGYWNLTELHYTKLTSMNNSYLTLLTELQIINVTTLSPPILTTTNHFYLQKKSPHIFLKNAYKMISVTTRLWNLQSDIWRHFRKVNWPRQTIFMSLQYLCNIRYNLAAKPTIINLMTLYLLIWPLGTGVLLFTKWISISKNKKKLSIWWKLWNVILDKTRQLSLQSEIWRHFIFLNCPRQTTFIKQKSLYQKNIKVVSHSTLKMLYRM